MMRKVRPKRFRQARFEPPVPSARQFPRNGPAIYAHTAVAYDMIALAS